MTVFLFLCVITWQFYMLGKALAASQENARWRRHYQAESEKLRTRNMEFVKENNTLRRREKHFREKCAELHTKLDVLTSSSHDKPTAAAGV